MQALIQHGYQGDQQPPEAQDQQQRAGMAHRRRDRRLEVEHGLHETPEEDRQEEQQRAGGMMPR